jgi:hypothetical protein
MALWNPNTDKIGTNEYLGRRLFDKPQLIGALDQKPRHRLRLEHFLEKRDGGETSLDRMGESCVNKGVRTYLAQRAIKAAGKFRELRQFNGWTVIHIKILRKPPHGTPISVVPSPITTAELDALDNNIYHAHALPEERSYNDMAFQLFWLFSEHGKTEYYKHELSWHEHWLLVRTWLLGRFRSSSQE